MKRINAFVVTILFLSCSVQPTADATTNNGKSTIAGSVSLITPGAVLSSNQRSLITEPTNAENAAAGPWVMGVAYWVPPDVTQVRLRIWNQQQQTGTTAAAIANVSVAIGTSNGANNFSGTPTQFTGNTIPSAGGDMVTSYAPVTRGADGKVFATYNVPTGDIFYDGSGTPAIGVWNTASSTVFPLSGAVANNTSVMNVQMEYTTTFRKVNVWGDSIANGFNLTSIEQDEFYMLGPTDGYAVEINALNGSTLTAYTDAAKPWLRSHEDMTGTIFICELGINDLGIPLNLAQFQTAYTNIVAEARAAGATRVVLWTITPSTTYGAADAVRVSVNSWLRTLPLSADAVIDAAAVLQNPANNAVLYPAYDSGDGIHPNAAGHAALHTAIATTLATLH